jgi:hypothetical protein
MSNAPLRMYWVSMRMVAQRRMLYHGSADAEGR